MNKDKVNLKDLTLNGLEDFCLSLGEKKFRGKQIFQWIYKGISDIDEINNIPLDFRSNLKKSSYISREIVEKKYESQIDGTTKYLLKLQDGNIIESVLMKYSFGISACLSTQVGCSMGCRFCASTMGGLVKDLSPGEMVGEILTMQRDSHERISNIVLMGSGEPLDNYDNVLKFLNIINNEEGLNIGMRHITLSTCGLIPEIIRLAEHKLQITLAVSLHAPNDDIRKRIMPVAFKYPVKDIIDACKYYADITNRRITFEYSLIDGVNDSNENARELSNLLKGLLCHVNLIPVNEIKEREYKKSTNQRVTEFRRTLEQRGIEVTVRRELGSDINAACGQLRKSFID